MTNTAELPPAVALPARVGQGTAIEQSRAVAEVQAQVIVAQRCPRDLTMARTLMQESTALPAVADRAFFRFPRGGKVIEGPTIQLARELARCFGNIQYGIVELRRDPGESEMMAFAWDVQTNTRATTTFIVPHRRDRTGDDGQPSHDPLIADRDIYEHNANAGGRRLRQMILAVIPPWFAEEAIDRCRATLNQGEGRSLEERRAGAIGAFDRFGVTVDRLERKVGRPADAWDAWDLSHLRIVHRSIERGEIAIDDEFPPARLTVADIEDQASPDEGTLDEPPPSPPDDQPPVSDPEPSPPPGPTPTPEATDTDDTGDDDPVDMPTLADFEALVHRRRGKLVKAVQAAFPDRPGDLATIEGIHADPQALDFALGWLERNPK